MKEILNIFSKHKKLIEISNNCIIKNIQADAHSTYANIFFHFFQQLDRKTKLFIITNKKQAGTKPTVSALIQPTSHPSIHPTNQPLLYSLHSTPPTLAPEGYEMSADGESLSLLTLQSSYYWSVSRAALQRSQMRAQTWSSTTSLKEKEWGSFRESGRSR